VKSMRRVFFLSVMVAWLVGVVPPVFGGGSFDYNLWVSMPGEDGVCSFQIINNSAGPTPNLTSFSIADFYSFSTPIFSSVPVGWSGTATLTSLCYYTVTFSINNPPAAIAPGSSVDGFAVECTKPDGASWYGQNAPYICGFDDNSTSVNPYGFAFSSTVIPEPASDLLAGLGILGLLLLRRRRK
jgi:MYXO-CTERM domain-containing protein